MPPVTYWTAPCVLSGGIGMSAAPGPWPSVQTTAPLRGFVADGFTLYFLLRMG